MEIITFLTLIRALAFLKIVVGKSFFRDNSKFWITQAYLLYRLFLTHYSTELHTELQLTDKIIHSLINNNLFSIIMAYSSCYD